MRCGTICRNVCACVAHEQRAKQNTLSSNVPSRHAHATSPSADTICAYVQLIQFITVRVPAADDRDIWGTCAALEAHGLLVKNAYSMIYMYIYIHQQSLPAPSRRPKRERFEGVGPRTCSVGLHVHVTLQRQQHHHHQLVRGWAGPEAYSLTIGRPFGMDLMMTWFVSEI